MNWGDCGILRRLRFHRVFLLWSVGKRTFQMSTMGQIRMRGTVTN